MKLQFKITARTLRHLGAELITSDEMAMNELMKNAFDAGSSRVKIFINFPMNPNDLSSILNKFILNKKSKEDSLSLIVDKINVYHYADSDTGRFLNFIEKHIDELTVNNIEKFLLRVKERFYSISVRDTGKGMTRDELQNNFLTIGTPAKLNQQEEGGRVILGEKGIGRLSMMKLGNIAFVKSKTIHDEECHTVTFDWTQFDKPNLYLEDISVSLGQAPSEGEAQGTEIKITDLLSDWTKLKAESFVKEYIQRLRNPFIKSRSDFPIDVYFNQHRIPVIPLPPWLERLANFKASYFFDPNGINNTNTVIEGSVHWKEVSTADIRTWSDIDVRKLLDIDQNTLDSLGRLTIEFLWFNRRTLKGSPDTSIKEIKNELNRWSGGFAIYRDGFRVGFTGSLNDDWLGLDVGVLKSSGYTFNRYQVIGAVHISKNDNPKLTDTANRQALVSNPEFDLLKKLFKEIIYKDIKKHIEVQEDLKVKLALDEASSISIENSTLSYRQACENLEQIKRSVVGEDKELLNEVNFVLKNQDEIIHSLHESIKLAKSTKVELLELANLGLTVDIVIHELARITQNTSTLLRDLNDSESKVGTRRIIDELKQQIVATNKRIRSIDFLSPSGRNRKQLYDIVKQINTLLNGYKSRFTRHNIEYQLTIDGESGKDIEVNVMMVRGLVTQIMENLLTNSAYWVQQGLKAGENVRRIHVDIDSIAKCVSVWDNGPGIRPEDKVEIFKPYYTYKLNGKGLGLYISSEIAAYHNSKLYLADEVEEDGRLRTFVIELPK